MRDAAAYRLEPMEPPLRTAGAYLSDEDGEASVASEDGGSSSDRSSGGAATVSSIDGKSSSLTSNPAKRFGVSNDFCFSTERVQRSSLRVDTFPKFDSLLSSGA